MKTEEYMESEFSSIFLSKTGRQKYSAWQPGSPTLSCFCSVMSLSEETYKCSEADCYIL